MTVQLRYLEARCVRRHQACYKPLEYNGCEIEGGAAHKWLAAPLRMPSILCAKYGPVHNRSTGTLREEI